MAAGTEVLDGVWRFEATHPEWSEDEGGGEDGWDPVVAWYAITTTAGVLVIDPLLEEPDALDALVAARDGCAGVLRTCRWHARSVAEVARRYGAEVYAKRDRDRASTLPSDHGLIDGDRLPGGLRVYDVLRADELAVLLPAQRALVFADAMIRRPDGTLRVCPESWTQPDGGPSVLRRRLAQLGGLPVEHVLVMHGPAVLGDAGPQLRAALP